MELGTDRTMLSFCAPLYAIYINAQKHLRGTTPILPTNLSHHVTLLHTKSICRHWVDGVWLWHRFLHWVDRHVRGKGVWWGVWGNLVLHLVCRRRCHDPEEVMCVVWFWTKSSVHVAITNNYKQKWWEKFILDHISLSCNSEKKS